MKITARQVRDGKGLRPVVEGLFHDGMGGQSLGGSEEVVWATLNLARFSASTLQELANQNSFNLLANRLMNVNGYPPETKVLAATKSGARIIEIQGKQFLSMGYVVHERSSEK
jgi:hypothetical protein